MTKFKRFQSLKRRKVTILLMVFCICVSTTFLLINSIISVALVNIPESEKIVIGAVSCRSKNSTTYNEETWVMIKSILISAQLYQVRLIELHLFLEHSEDGELLHERLMETGYINTDSSSRPRVTFHTHSAVDIVPENYRSDMVYHKRWRCGYVRFFYPDALPDVDSIIHLDSDIIYTGNIRKLWEYFGDMDSQQMVGVSAEREPENDEFPDYHNGFYGQIPHVPPHGVNNGVMVMNLTRMRNFGLSNKICEIHDEYYENVTRFSGQKALNILLHFHPELMQLIPCHFNFASWHCSRGFFCQAAKTDVYGIQLVHGVNFMFEKHRHFYSIYEQYQKFNLTGNMADIVEKLMKPVRNSFDRPAVGKREKCSGTLNHLLFPNFFEGAGL